MTARETIRLRTVAIGFMLVILSIMLTLTGVVAFQALRHPPRTLINPDVFKAENYMYHSDQKTGWVPRPNTTMVSRTSVQTIVHTDSRGARVNRLGNDASGPVDLVTVGCSQAWGQGLPNEATFTEVLGRKTGMRVANFSVPGYGGVASMILLKRKLALHPKVAVYGFWEDHLKRNVTRCAAIGGPVCLEMPVVQEDSTGIPSVRFPNTPDRSMQLTRRWFLETATATEEYRNFLTDFYWSGFQLLRLAQKALHVSSEAGASPSERQDKLMAAKFVLDQMQQASEAAGARLVVVYIPTYFGQTIEEAPREMIEFAGQQGIMFVSMARRFRDMKSAGTAIGIPADNHLNAQAHEAVAEEVIRIMKESNAAQRLSSLRKT